MARIAGVNIPQNKVVHVALTYIHGIGKKFSNNICTKLNILKSKRVNGKATPEETNELLEEGLDVATIPCLNKLEN